MSILDDARQLVTNKREQEARERQTQQQDTERWHKDAIFESLEILGLPNPRRNYGDKLRRVAGVTWPCFAVAVMSEGLTVRNASKVYPNIIELEEHATGRKLTVNTTAGIGEHGTITKRREMWMAQIAKEWYGL